MLIEWFDINKPRHEKTKKLVKLFALNSFITTFRLGISRSMIPKLSYHVFLNP